MAFLIYNSIWGNEVNRSIIFSFLMTTWCILIQLYFLFWPISSIQANLFTGWLYISIFGHQILLDIFLVIIWGICFFFTWVIYTYFKESLRMGQSNLNEYLIFIVIFEIFITILNFGERKSFPTIAIFATVFFLITLIELVYMYITLTKLSAEKQEQA